MASKATFRAFLAVGFFGLSSLLGGQAWGWGQIGHRTVGQVADHYLYPQVKIELAKILNNQSLASVSTWADTIKQNPAWKHTSSYHFQDIPDGQNLMSNIQSQTPAQQRNGGVVEAILQAEQDYINGSNPTDMQNDVKFLVHFIGDVHQPLHAGRPEDLGGNKIPIRWNGFQTNLHAVWDSQMIETGHKDIFQSYPKQEEVPYAQYLMQKFANEPVDEESLNDVNVWVNEDIAPRQSIYDQKNLPADQYTAQFLDLADHRIYQAGIRLANFLNQMVMTKQAPQVRMDLISAIEQITGSLKQFLILTPVNSAMNEVAANNALLLKAQ